MKSATLFVFLLLGTCMPKENNSNTEYGIVTFILRNDDGEIRRMIVEACEKNNLDISSELKFEEINAASCIHKSTEKYYWEKLRKCNGGIVNKTTSCLDEKYLPRLIQDIDIEKFKEGYISNSEFDDCRKILNTKDVSNSIFECVGTYDKGDIPPTKTKFCETLRPAATCVSDGIMNNCEDTSMRNKIISILERIIKNVCN